MAIARIADRAGVAPSTVSKVLNHYPGVSESTRERVWQAARALGVMPRRYRAATDEPERTVLLLPLATALFSEIQREPRRLAARAVTALRQSLAARKLNLMIGPDYLTTPEAIAYIREHAGKRFGGIVVLPPVDAELAELLHHRRIPCVCLSGSVDSRHLVVVTPDHSQGTSLVMQHLIGLGHRRIGYIGSGLSSRSHVERLEGYLAQMRLAGLDCRDEWVMQPDVAERIDLTDRSVERWLGDIARFLTRCISRGDLPTAWVCVNDDFAHKVVQLLSLHGLRVPDDVSVTGWGDELDGSLTTVDARAERVGELAGTWIAAMLSDRDAAEGRHLVPVRLLIRGSTAAPPTLD